MKLTQITIENFRLFEHDTFSFEHEFNLVLGVNGRGKTSLLNAIAVTLGGWAYAYVKMRDGENTRAIRKSEIHVAVSEDGSYVEAKKIQVSAQFLLDVIDQGGEIKTDSRVNIIRSTNESASTTALDAFVDYKNTGKKEYGFSLLNYGQAVYQRIISGDKLTLPIIAFYECGRLWQVKDVISPAGAVAEQQDRMEPYKDWFHTAADHRVVAQLVIKHQLATLQEGTETPTFQVLQLAVQSALEGCSGIHFEIKTSRVYLSFHNGQRILFDHLSDGQRTLIGLFCDLARRAIILNPHFGTAALAETPGIVLIDELDLHLHPRWQRKVIADLRRTFPRLQFICTTHSPQLIGQVKPHEIILLDAASPAERKPNQSFGMDSNWVLRHLMGADERDPATHQALDLLFEQIDETKFEDASAGIEKLRETMSGDTPELVEANAYISRYGRFNDAKSE